MTAVNVGAAYVELGVKYDDTIKRVGDDIAGLDRTAAKVSGQITNHFTRGFKGVKDEATRTGEGVGSELATGITKKLEEAFHEVSSSFGIIGSTAEKAFSSITSNAGLVAIGVGGIGLAAAGVVKQLYDLGRDWDTITDNITIRTGLTGDALNRITDSVKRVGAESAASLSTISGIEAQLTSTLGLTGSSLDEVSLKLADLQELTGDQVNIRELAKVFHGFNTDADQMGDSIDQLYDTFTRTQIPVSELTTLLATAGPTARTLGLDIGQLSSLLVTLNDAGIQPTSAINALRLAMANLSKEKPPKGVLGDFLKAEDGKDITTKIEDLITELQKTGNIDLARQAFGRSFQDIFDAIRNGKLTAEDFNKSMETTGHTIEGTKKATDDWDQKLSESVNKLKSDLAPAATAVFDTISHALEHVIDLVDSFNVKLSGIKVPGVTPGAQLPGVNLFPGLYGQPPGVNPPGPTGLPYGTGGLGGASAGGVPLTPGQQQGLMHGTATPGMIQWQVYDPSTGKWTIKEVPKPVVPEPKPPPAPPGAPPLLPPTSELDTSGGAAASKALPPAPSLPYNTALPPGFLQLPQTAELLSSESGFIDARHDVEEKQARVDQLAKDNNATENDIQNARNDLYQAQTRQQQAELKLYDSRQAMFDKQTKAAEDQNKKIDEETKKYQSQFSGGSLIDFLLYLMFQPTIDQIRQKIHAPEIAAAGAGSAAGLGGSLQSFGLGGPGSFTGGQAAQAGFRVPYGLPPGVNSGGYGGGGVQFPDWVNQVANYFGIKPSTYPGHQETNRDEAGYAPNPEHLNRAIDWTGPVDALQRFDDYLKTIPQDLEQVIWKNPNTGVETGIAGGRDVSGSYYSQTGEGSYAEHTGHVHTRQSMSIPLPGAAGIGVGGGGGGSGLNWDALADKESGGNWSIDTGNGYTGGFQFDAATWAQYGGTQYAPTAGQATKQQQIAVAQAAYNARGGGQTLWPANYQQLGIPGMQDGGQVPGWGGGDQHPILTEGGEWVVPKDQAAQHAAALQAITDGANSDQLLQQLADQAPGGQHLPPGGPLPIGPTGMPPGNAAQAAVAPKTGRTGGYIPSGAGASGQAGSSLFSGAVGMGADVINYFIDTAASLASEAASAAMAAGTMGASAATPAAGAAAGFGIQVGADIAKRAVSYGAQVLGILGDSAMEIMSPFGVPRLWQTDPKQFMPQIGALPAAITTGEKALAGDQSAGGPVQPGQLPGTQPVGPPVKKAEASGVTSLPVPPIQGVLDSLTPKLPGVQQHIPQGGPSAPGPGPVPPSAQAGAATASYRSGAYDANSAGTHNDYSVHVQSVTVKDVNEMSQSMADKQRLQMMRYAGRPS